MINYDVITTEEGVRQSCALFDAFPAIGLDLETTALEPRNGDIRLIQLSNGEHTKIFDVRKIGHYGKFDAFKKLLTSNRPRKVIHFSQFEHGWIEDKFGIEIQGVFDTYLGAKLVNMQEKAGLAAVAQRYLGVELDKTEQTSDWNVPELSQEQLEYAALDVVYSVKLREKILEELFQNDLLKIAEIEFNCASTTAHIENSGFPVDPEMYKVLCKTLEHDRDSKQLALKELLESALGYKKAEEAVVQAGLFSTEDDLVIKRGDNEINLRSHVQIKKAFAALGIDLPSTGKLVIEPLLKRHPRLQYLMDFRAAEKLIGSYGWNIIEARDPITGRIHASFKQLGTDTGRYSCVKPNIQQVPHGKEFRQCFRPLEGRKFVISDYSLIELRILAHLSRDMVMCRAFREGLDIHSVTAKNVFNLTCDVKDIKRLFPELRDLGKRLNFGVVYGAGAKKFSNMVGISEHEAKKHITNFYKLYKGAKDYLDEIELIGVSNKSVRTLGGRLIKFIFDPDDKKVVSKVRRNSRNSPIQGLTGDILKTALPQIRKQLKVYNNACIVNIIHDEVVVECDVADAAQVAHHVETEMVNAATPYITEVPVYAETVIGNSWSDKS